MMAENDINNEEQYKIAANKLIEYYKNNKPQIYNIFKKENKNSSLDDLEDKSKIKRIYNNFKNFYSLEELKKYTDEDILNKYIFTKGNKDNLCYKLEYAIKVGGIGQASVFIKYGLCKNETGWHLGSSSKNSESINKERAIKEGKKQIELIVKGGRVIEKYIKENKLYNLANYDELDSELWQETSEFSTKPWVRKYYHLLFPEYFCNWFSDNKLSDVLTKLGIANQSKTYYGKCGQLMKIYKNTGLDNPVLVMFVCVALLNIENEDEDDENEDSEEINENSEEKNMELFSLNQILYGPPGTGKTYNTAIYAVAICDGKTIEDVKKESYTSVLKRYRELKNAGRIAFTTFHQSYGYEEFIEGIKPVLNEESSNSEISELKYTLEKGIFRSFCEKISEKSSLATLSNKKTYGFNDNPTVWKVSLYKSYDNSIREECLKNNHIRIGWEEYGPDITDDMKYDIGGKATLNAFINLMQKGDIVFSCYNQTMIDAIGVITGDYEWDDSYKEYNRVRKVNWIIKDKIDILELNGGKNMVQSTVYRMSITVSDVKRLLTEKYPNSFDSNNQMQVEPYVFIIDEINRGNISKIFGELITLIEERKRTGNSEEMETILPYSHKLFGVPKNLYIIGTMNTSDRSIASIDIALRRRFTFKEMMPDKNRVTEEIKENNTTIKLQNIFNTLNKRISVLLDRDHQIGHSYFMNVKCIDDLKKVWFNCIMPLLNEYFYNDWEKLQALLGKAKLADGNHKYPSFVKKIEKVDFADSDYQCDEDEQYDFVSDTEIDFEEALNHAFSNQTKSKEES